MAPGPPWTNPFLIEELIVHKKYNKRGRDSKVVQTLTTMFENPPQNRLKISAQGRLTERHDYDIAIFRLDYPIMDERTGITVLEVLKSPFPHFSRVTNFPWIP